jgi:spore coat protein U-like protein
MKVRALSALAAAIAFSGFAQAETLTADLNVSATVAGACLITAQPTAIAFGNYFPSFSGDIDGDSSFDITCVTGAPYSITVGLGNGTGATAASRKMSDGSTGLLNYSLYSSAANRNTASAWSSGASAVSGTGNGSAVTVPVFGRVFGGQTTVAAGAYSDTVVITLTF